VRALWLIAEKARYGELYNLCAGKGYSINDLLNILVASATAQIPVQVDPTRFRNLDVPEIVGDNTKLKDLGWQPEIPIHITLQDTLNFWRCATLPSQEEDT
jgi:GDP-4-dehydro-6-deoxy-D-mannose reductase